MLRVVKNMTWRRRITNEVLYTGLPRISTPERGDLRSAVIAVGVKMKLLVIWFCWNPSIAKEASEDRLAHNLLEAACWRRWVTGMAGEAEPWGLTEVDLVVAVIVCLIV